MNIFSVSERDSLCLRSFQKWGGERSAVMAMPLMQIRLNRPEYSRSSQILMGVVSRPSGAPRDGPTLPPRQPRRRARPVRELPPPRRLPPLSQRVEERESGEAYASALELEHAAKCRLVRARRHMSRSLSEASLRSLGERRSALAASVRADLEERRDQKRLQLFRSSVEPVSRACVRAWATATARRVRADAACGRADAMCVANAACALGRLSIVAALRRGRCPCAVLRRQRRRLPSSPRR